MLEVVLLGPVEVQASGIGVPLAPLERNLLALLALSPRTVLSTERIIDGLWGERPPAAPRSRVQGLVSTLRRKLGDVLITRHPGYLLDLADEAGDLARCEDLAARARRAEKPAEAAGLLRRALGLWRGEPLDGVTSPGVDADRVRLAELRAGLMEDLFEAELALGRHKQIVGELLTAVAAHPLRERLAGQLMLALYRGNRQADALRAYQALRERLADELGGEPCADLRDLHTMILRGETREPAPPVQPEPRDEPRPAQMPASSGHFTGREGELAALTAALPGDGDEPHVLVVCGAGGLGKTALVVRWAHAVADRFPDGQIYVELRGAADPLPPGSALGSVLLALGVAAEQLPVSLDERAALYRTLTHGRRVLIVADGASSAGQILPLVPPTPGSVVVVTGRNRLGALAAHHAVRTLALEPLDEGAAGDLLRAIVGAERLRGPGAAEIVDLCGGWPLALRLAGATLAARRRQSLPSFAEELRERVDVLSVADDPRTIRGALTETHGELDPAVARLFGQLGLLPGATISLALAAAAAGTSLLRARRLLDELMAAGLVVETGPDRYWLHEMVRRHARRCGRRLPDHAVVEERVTRWYLSVFDTLAREAEPDREWPPVAGHEEWSPFAGDAAGPFVSAEGGNLAAVIAWAAKRDPRTGWRLVSLAHAAGAALDAETAELGLSAARTLDDRRAVGEAHARLGLVLVADPGRLNDTDGHLTLAVELLDSGHGRLPSAASFALGLVRARQSRQAEARDSIENALRYMDPGREPIAYAIALLGYAQVLVRAGSLDRGHERFAQAVILCQAAIGSRGDRFGRFERGWVHLDQQLADEYLDHLDRSLDATRVTPADRALSRALIAVSRALRVREATGPAIPAQRRRDMAAPRRDRDMVAPYRDTAETYPI